MTVCLEGNKTFEKFFVDVVLMVFYTQKGQLILLYQLGTKQPEKLDSIYLKPVELRWKLYHLILKQSINLNQLNNGIRTGEENIEA
ncbi:hypothetical protein AAH994_10870 [Weeksellaceae bacterium A-14]